MTKEGAMSKRNMKKKSWKWNVFETNIMEKEEIDGEREGWKGALKCDVLCIKQYNSPKKNPN